MIQSKPRIANALSVARIAAFTADAKLEGVKFEDGVDLLGVSAKNVSIDEGELRKANFAQAKLERLSLGDVLLESCDFSATDCSDGSWVRVQVTGGRMTGVDLNKSLLKDVLFKDCKLDMANFRFAKLVNVRFEDCVLSEADFQGAELSGVEFAGCLLEKTEFGQCKLKNVDLRTSQIINLRGWEYMKGAILDPTQLITLAPELALALGLKISD